MKFLTKNVSKNLLRLQEDYTEFPPFTLVGFKRALSPKYYLSSVAWFRHR